MLRGRAKSIIVSSFGLLLLLALGCQTRTETLSSITEVKSGVMLGGQGSQPPPPRYYYTTDEMEVEGDDSTTYRLWIEVCSDSGGLDSIPEGFYEITADSIHALGYLTPSEAAQEAIAQGNYDEQSELDGCYGYSTIYTTYPPGNIFKRVYCNSGSKRSWWDPGYVRVKCWTWASGNPVHFDDKDKGLGWEIWGSGYSQTYPKTTSRGFQQKGWHYFRQGNGWYTGPVWVYF